VSVRVSFARDVKNSHGAAVSEGMGGNGGFELAQETAMAHQGPKRAGFGIPPGFLPDQATGYYYSSESGYYYDAASKLYYHPTTMLWYETDTVTGMLKEHISEAQQAAIDAANAAAIAAKTAAADAARAAAAAAAAEPPPPAEAAPLVENHSKVVLGLGKGKKGVAKVVKPVAVFKQAVAEEETAEQVAEKEWLAQLKAEQSAMVDFTTLICNFCRRKFKDGATLTKHCESSELHATNLQEWKAGKEAEHTAALAAAAAAPKGGLLRHWAERKEVPAFMRPDHTLADGFLDSIERDDHERRRDRRDSRDGRDGRDGRGRDDRGRDDRGRDEQRGRDDRSRDDRSRDGRDGRGRDGFDSREGGSRDGFDEGGRERGASAGRGRRKWYGGDGGDLRGY